MSGIGRSGAWRSLDMIDALAGWELAPPLVVADAGYGDITEFRDGLSARGRAWVVQVQGVLSAHAEDAIPELKPYAGRGRPPRPRYRTTPGESLPHHPGRVMRRAEAAVSLVVDQPAPGTHVKAKHARDEERHR
jgi:hypothetical protein